MPRTSAISYLSSPDALALAQTYATNVRRALSDRRMSIRRLAAETGMNQNTLGNILQNRVTPNLIGAAAIARVLDTTVDRLLGLPIDMDIRGDRLICLHERIWLEGTTACEHCQQAWIRLQNAKQAIYASSRLANAPALLSADDGAPIIPGHPEWKEPAR